MAKYRNSSQNVWCMWNVWAKRDKERQTPDKGASLICMWYIGLRCLHFKCEIWSGNIQVVEFTDTELYAHIIQWLIFLHYKLYINAENITSDFCIYILGVSIHNASTQGHVSYTHKILTFYIHWNCVFVARVVKVEKSCCMVSNRSSVCCIVSAAPMHMWCVSVLAGKVHVVTVYGRSEWSSQGTLQQFCLHWVYLQSPCE